MGLQGMGEIKDPATLDKWIRKDGLYFDHASKELRDDKAVVMNVMINSKPSACLCFASPRLRSDRDVVLAAIKNGASLADAHRVFQDDKEIVLIAVKRDGYELLYASKRLRSDEEVIAAAIATNPGAADFALPADKKNIDPITDLAIVELSEPESISFAGKIFACSGLESTQEATLIKEVEKRKGVVKKGVSGKTDYYILNPDKGFGSVNYWKVIDLAQKGTVIVSMTFEQFIKCVK